MYVSPYIIGAIAGVIGTIAIEVIAAVIYMKKSKK